MSQPLVLHVHPSRDQIILSELQRIQLLIGSIERHELLMRSALPDLSVHDDRDFIRIANGGEAVGHHQRRAAFAQFIQGMLDQDFRRIVQCAGRFVQDQDGRILEEDAGNAQSLLLSAGQLHAALADLRVIPVFEGHDVVMDIGTLGSLLDFLKCGIRPSVEDIVADGADKQEDILLHNPDIPPHRFERQVPDVRAIDQDGSVPFPELVEIREQMAERRLSAAGRSDQGQLSALGNGEVHMSQYFLGIVVAVAHIAEFNVALHMVEHFRIRRIRLRLLVHDFLEALEAADTVLVLFHEVDEGIDGVDEQIDRDDEGGVIAEGDPSRVEEETAGNEDNDIENVGNKRRGGGEFSHRMVRSPGGVDKLLVAPLKLFDFPVGIGVGLRYADARHAALHRRVDRGVALTPVIKRLAHFLAVMHGHRNQNRHAGEDNERQDPVNAAQVGKREQNHDRADQEIFRAVVGQLAHFKQVTRDPGHDASRLMIVIEAEGQFFQMRKQILPHAALHLDADEMPVVLDEIAHEHADKIECQHKKTRKDDR